MEGSVYPESLTPLGIDFAIPEKEDRGRINDIIFDELVYGKLMMRSWSFHNRPGKPVKVAWNTIQKVHIELWTDIPSRIELFLSDGKKVSINLGDIDGEDREDLIRTLTIR